jgi:hypothetical protein
VSLPLALASTVVVLYSNGSTNESIPLLRCMSSSCFISSFFPSRPCHARPGQLDMIRPYQIQRRLLPWTPSVVSPIADSSVTDLTSFLFLLPHRLSHSGTFCFSRNIFTIMIHVKSGTPALADLPLAPSRIHPHIVILIHSYISSVSVLH